MSNKLFSEVLNGKKPESSFQGLDESTLKALKNSAASIISRADTLEKIQRATYLKGLIQIELAKVAPKKVQAEWRTKDEEALSLEDVNKALKQAQWYKHTYGPKAKANWSAIAKTTTDAALKTKAVNFLDKCDDIYAKSLEDEAKWLQIKDGMNPEGTKTAKPEVKVDELTAILAEVEQGKVSKQTQSLIDRLKALVENK